jgi:hypothetical protein
MKEWKAVRQSHEPYQEIIIHGCDYRLTDSELFAALRRVFKMQLPKLCNLLLITSAKYYELWMLHFVLIAYDRRMSLLGVSQSSI